MSTLKVNTLQDTSGNPLDRVGQTISKSTTSTVSTTSTSYVDISSSLNITITPTSTTSKILFLFSACCQIDGGRARYDIHYSGTNTQLGVAQQIAEQGGSSGTGITALEGAANNNRIVHYSYVHSPATTSAITYKPQHKNPNGNQVETGKGNPITFTAIELIQ
tara:strand:- start:374 stop:862 length:489 start_codon:yes stop_codon:yes gene_type:complete